MVEGAVKGAGGLVSGTSNLIRKGLSKISPELAEKIIPEQGLSSLQTSTAPKNTFERLGYGGEGLLEFLTGDEALKGLSLADKLKHVSQVASIFEKSPSLMRAVQTGTNVIKAIGEMGAEEQAAIAKSPILARLVSAGMDAMRMGAVQAGQTLVHSGGDVGQAAKEGATMAGTAGVLGAAGGAATGALEKAGTAAKAAETLGKVVKEAPSDTEVTSGAKSAVDSVEKSMHDKFEAGIQDLKQRLQGASTPNENSPISAGAKELLKAPEPAEHELVAAAKEATGERLDQPVKDLLAKASGSTQPWTVNDLVDFRQSVRKLADSYDMGDPNARALRKLLPSVDDTIGKLAEQSGDATAKQDYSNLRNDYKNTIKYFQPSAKTADRLAYNTASVLRSGTKDDIGKYLLSGGNVRAKIGAVSDLLGPDETHNLGKDIFSTLVKKNSSGARVNPANLIADWNKIPDEAKAKLFDTSIADTTIQQLMTDSRTAAQMQHLARLGLISGAGAAGATGVGHLWVGTLLGLTIGEAAHGGIQAARNMLDYVTTHPAVWKSLGMASKAGETVTPYAKALGPAIKQQAAQSLMGKPALTNILQGASQPLSQEQQ